MRLSIRGDGHWVGLWDHGFLHAIPDLARHLEFVGAARLHGSGSLALSLKRLPRLKSNKDVLFFSNPSSSPK